MDHLDRNRVSNTNAPTGPAPRLPSRLVDLVTNLPTEVDTTLLTPAEVSGMSRVTERTLANRRSLGMEPAYIKLSPGRGGRIRYRRSDIEEWLRSKEVRG